MFKGLSTVKLLAILVAVIAIYFIVKFTSGSSRSASYRESLVELDTAKVSKIEIETAAETVSLFKEENEWWVGEKPATKSSVESFMSTLSTIEPSRIASRKQDSWKDFQVDSTGTRVKIYEGGDNVLDIVIGRFGVEGQRSFYSYVRLSEESDTYVAENFMGMSLSKTAADFRNGKVLALDKDSISSIDFNYADSAFTLRKSVEGAWLVASEAADSANVATYLSGVTFVNSRNFTESPGSSSDYEVIYHLNGSDDISVKGYGDNVFSSSSNEFEAFQDKTTHDKLFKGKSYFLK